MECPWPEWECHMTCAIDGCKKRRKAVTGWVCPACGKGNAPGVEGCVHCAMTIVTSYPACNTDASAP